MRLAVIFLIGLILNDYLDLLWRDMKQLNMKTERLHFIAKIARQKRMIENANVLKKKKRISI